MTLCSPSRQAENPQAECPLTLVLINSGSAKRVDTSRSTTLDCNRQKWTLDLQRLSLKQEEHEKHIPRNAPRDITTFTTISQLYHNDIIIYNHKYREHWDSGCNGDNIPQMFQSVMPAQLCSTLGVTRAAGRRVEVTPRRGSLEATAFVSRPSRTAGSGGSSARVITVACRGLSHNARETEFLDSMQEFEHTGASLTKLCGVIGWELELSESASKTHGLSAYIPRGSEFKRWRPPLVHPSIAEGIFQLVIIIIVAALVSPNSAQATSLTASLSSTIGTLVASFLSTVRTLSPSLFATNDVNSPAVIMSNVKMTVSGEDLNWMGAFPFASLMVLAVFQLLPLFVMVSGVLARAKVERHASRRLTVCWQYARSNGREGWVVRSSQSSMDEGPSWVGVSFPRMLPLPGVHRCHLCGCHAGLRSHVRLPCQPSTPSITSLSINVLFSCCSSAHQLPAPPIIPGHDAAAPGSSVVDYSIGRLRAGTYGSTRLAATAAGATGGHVGREDMGTAAGGPRERPRTAGSNRGEQLRVAPQGPPSLQMDGTHHYSRSLAHHASLARCTTKRRCTRATVTANGWNRYLRLDTDTV
eukprot:1177451-Prorocentrum_minimum.AAC.2